MSDTLATLNRIKALEQAHAELAAKVDRWILQVAALESPAPVPDRVQCPVCGEMANEESLVTGVWEGEARCNCPAPDPVCATCEGTRIQCFDDKMTYIGPRPCPDCFVPTADPAPLDPVLVEFVAKWIADHAESSVCNWDDCVEENQRDYRSYAESAIDAIRAYGRDGAR